MNKAKVTGNWLLSHKCIIFIVFFVVEIVFLDHNSLISRYRINKQKSELSAELQRYRQISNNANKQLKALEEDPTAIEKIARERYFMKTADEDVYIVEYPDQDGSKNSVAE